MVRYISYCFYNWKEIFFCFRTESTSSVKTISANIIIKYTCSIYWAQMINEMERVLAISSWTSCSKGYASTGRHSQIGFVSHKIPKVEHKSELSSLLRGQYLIRKVFLYFSRKKKIGFSYPFSFSFVVCVGAQMKIRASFIDADWIFSAFILVYRSASFCFRIKRISTSVLFIFRKPNFVFAMYYMKLFNIFLIFSQL